MLIGLAPSAARADVLLECDGSGTAEGYPMGRYDTGSVKYRVTIDQTSVAVFDISRREPAAFCSSDARCSISTDAALAELMVRDIPGRDPLYTQSFRLDRDKKTFRASGGGLDGGWTQTGTCKTVAE
jgi:hypothetical protein